MNGSGVAHFSIPSSVNNSVGLCGKDREQKRCHAAKGKEEEQRAKGKVKELRRTERLSASLFALSS